MQTTTAEKKKIIPWITTEILNLMKKRDIALKSAIKSRASRDRHIFTMLRNRVVKEIRMAKANFFLTIIKKAGSNTKIIWSQLNKLKGHNVNNAKSLELVSGKLINKPAEVVDAFNHFIDSVENIKYFSSEYKNTSCQVRQTEPAFNIEYITEADVMRVIRSLRPSLAKDVIGMNTIMLKDLSESLVYPITKIVNLSFA